MKFSNEITELYFPLMLFDFIMLYKVESGCFATKSFRYKSPGSLQVEVDSLHEFICTDRNFTQ